MKKIIIIFLTILININLVYSQIKIKKVKGKVQVLLISTDKKNWKKAQVDMILSDKDKIRTGKNSSINLKSKSYDIIVHEKSILLIDSVFKQDNKLTILNVINGKIRIISSSITKEEKIIIQTKNSEITPTGTDFVVDFNGTSKTKAYVFNGKVNMLNPNKPASPMEIKAYQMSSIKGKNPPLKPTDIPENILNQYNIPPKPQLIKPLVVEPPKKIMKIIEPIAVTEKKEIKPLAEIPKKEQPKPKEEIKEKPEPKPEPEKKEENKPEEKKEPWCKDPTLKFHLNFDIMYSEFNNVGHILLALMPEFIYCRIGLGLYLPIYYNYKYNFLKPKKSWYNHNEWDFASPSDSAHDLWIKFLYIRYGKKGDPLYIRIGGLNSVSLGNGFIINDYSNMLNFPKIRKLGLQFDYIYNKIVGVETIFDDMSNLKLYGGRFLGFPLWFNPNPGLLNKLQLGLTLMYNKMDENNRVINWGIDLGLPLIQSEMFNLHYGIDLATFSVNAQDLLNKTGWVSSDNYGFSTGFKGNIAILIYRAEYRYLKDGYIPEYFDSFFDIQRKNKYLALITMYNSSLSTLNGYLANIGFRIGQAGEIGFVYQEYYGDDNYTTNKTKLYLTLSRGVISKFYGTAAYHKLNVVGLTGKKSLFGNLYDPNTMLSFDGGVGILPFSYITLSYRKTFEYDSVGNLQSYETYSTGFSIGF